MAPTELFAAPSRARQHTCPPRRRPVPCRARIACNLWWSIFRPRPGKKAASNLVCIPCARRPKELLGCKVPTPGIPTVLAATETMVMALR